MYRAKSLPTSSGCRLAVRALKLDIAHAAAVLFVLIFVGFVGQLVKSREHKHESKLENSATN